MTAVPAQRSPRSLRHLLVDGLQEALVCRMMRARWLARRHSRLRRRARPDRCSACRTDLADLRVTRSSTPLAVGSFRLIHGVGTPQLQFGEPRHVLEVSIGAEQTEVPAQAQPGDQRINRAHLDSPRAARCVQLGGLPVVGSTRNQQRQFSSSATIPSLTRPSLRVWSASCITMPGRTASPAISASRTSPHEGCRLAACGATRATTPGADGH